MEKKIKLINTRQHGVKINLMAISQKVIPVAPSKDGKVGFAFVTKEELAYMESSSKVFERGTFKVADEDKEEVNIPDSPNAKTTDDIKAMLKKAPSKSFDKELDKIDNVETLRTIVEVAKELDKPMSVISALEGKIEKLIG